MGIVRWLANALSAIGAMNWGLVKFFQFNLVTEITRMAKIENLDTIIYAVVALSGLLAFIFLFSK